MNKNNNTTLFQRIAYGINEVFADSVSASVDEGEGVELLKIEIGDAYVVFSMDGNEDHGGVHMDLALKLMMEKW